MFRKNFMLLSSISEFATTESFKLPNIMLRSERIPSCVEMMLKMIHIAYFYAPFIHLLQNICTLLAIKFFAQKNVKLTHRKLSQVSNINFSIECFHYMLMLSLNQLDLCRIGGDWFHCTGQLCMARMWLSRPSISMPRTHCNPIGQTKPRQPAKHYFQIASGFVFLGLNYYFH